MNKGNVKIKKLDLNKKNTVVGWKLDSEKLKNKKNVKKSKI